MRLSCGHQRFCGFCITKIEEERRGCPMWRVPRANHHDSAPVLVFFARHFPEVRFSDICLRHVRPICNFAVQQSLRLCRPFYFGLSINKIGVACV